jgi:ribose transport system substrate-binding protein
MEEKMKKNVFKGVLFFLVCLTAAGLLSGCNRSAKSKEGALDLKTIYAKIGDADSHVSTRNIPLPQSKRNYKIGIALYGIDSGFFKALQDTAIAEIQASGSTVLVANCDGNVSTQVSQIENFITQGVDAIISEPADPASALNLTLQKVYNAGIPVIAFDMPFDPGAPHLTSVVTDGYALGTAVGVEVATILLKNYPAGKIEYGIIGGIEGAAQPMSRNRGFQDGVKSVDKEGRIEMVTWLFPGDFTEEGGLRLAENMLVAHPNLKCIIGTSDPQVVGAAAAMRRLGKENVMLAACDGSRTASEIMKNGGPIKVLGINSPVEASKLAVRMLINVLNGEEPPESKLTFMEPFIVTNANINEYYDPNSAF